MCERDEKGDRKTGDERAPEHDGASFPPADEEPGQHQYADEERQPARPRETDHQARQAQEEPGGGHRPPS